MNFLRWIALHRRAYTAASMLLVLLLASAVAWQANRIYDSDREQHLSKELGTLASTLESGTINSQAMGAAILLGLEHQDIKKLVLGKLHQDAPSVLSGIEAARSQFIASAVFLVNGRGKIVAFSGEDRSNLAGRDLSSLPYVKLSLQGTPNVYPDVGAAADDRDIYLAAPVRSTTDHRSRSIGALVVKVGANKLDMVLDSWPHGVALLLSPAGKVFSASHRKWLFPEISANRIDAVQPAGRTTFEEPRSPRLPFSPWPFSLDAPEAIIEGVQYAVSSIPLEWHDPEGGWRLVGLERHPPWWSDRNVLGLSGLTGLFIALGLIWLYSLARHEYELFKSDALLRESQNIAAVGGYVLDIQTRLFSISAEMYNLCGVDKSYDHSTAGWMSLIHPEEREMVERYYIDEVLGQGKPFDKEYRIIRPNDQAERWVHGLGKLEFDSQGHPVKMHGTLQDITERKRLAQQLETILEKSPTGIAVFESGGPCILANEAYSRLVGATPEEVQKQNYRDSPAWQRNGLLNFAEQAFATNSTVRRDIEGIFSFGKQVALECILAPIILSGKPHLLLLVNDIRDRVEAKRALDESMNQLEQKELSKTRFLAAAGHDLRQPVAAAVMFVEILKQSSPNEYQKEMILRLEKSMNVFSGLLDCLLDISKLDAGLVKPQFGVFNLAEIFNWLDQDFSQIARARNLRFDFFYPRNKSITVRTDLDLLQSVMMNLVSNALKFTARGGILISARLRGDSVVLQVWDTGIGIAEAHLPFIFDEFYQVSNPQRDRGAGLGLGLASCQRRMALLGGKVTCRSRFGRGSVFELGLPLNAMNEIIRPQGAAALPEVADSFVSGKHLVLVEDDKLVSEAMSLMLQSLGAEIRVFNNAEQALQHDDIGNADYFIVDYSLGKGLNGLQFLESVQQKRPARVRAVILTGETSSQFLSGVSNSPWPVLNKPVNISSILAKLNR